MSKIRSSAKGEECALQIAPWCNHNPETVVLAHMPCDGKGMAIKGPDEWSAYSCSACHDVIDGRNAMAVRDLGWAEIYRCMMRGIYRTQQKLKAKGLMKVAS